MNEPTYNQRFGRINPKLVIALSLGVCVIAVGYWQYIKNADGPPPKIVDNGSAPIATIAIDPEAGLKDVDDPSQDGWDTEAFSNRAKDQFKKLGKLIVNSSPIGPEQTADFVAEQFSCQSLRPESLTNIFDESNTQVQRADVKPATDRSADAFQGVAGFAKALTGLAQPFRKGPEFRFHSKIFRVVPADSTVITKHYISLSGRTETGMREETATWTVAWEGKVGAGSWLTLPDDQPDSSDSGPPRMTRIVVDTYEQVTTENPDGPWFVECTPDVIGKNKAYQNQLLTGYHTWLSRIQIKGEGIGNWLGTPGIAIGDVNGDGLDDLYLCQERGLPNRLFLQRSDGTAVDASADSGTDWLEQSRSALLVDFDNDGDQDLAVAIFGGVVMAANDGQGRFQIKEVLPTTDSAFSLSAADYDLDGNLDLYVGAYDPNSEADGSPQEDAGLVGARGLVIHDANVGGPNTLFRNDGDMNFTDVTANAGLDVSNRRFSFAAAWEDIDNDGDQDLYVANDYGRDNLYRNEGGHFVEISATAGAEDSAAGMGVSWGDYNRDGWMDAYVSNMFSSAGNRVTFQPSFKPESEPEVKVRLQRFGRGNTLLTNSGAGDFADVSGNLGVELGRWAWGTGFVDLDNNGWEDLVVANGYVTTEDTKDL